MSATGLKQFDDTIHTTNTWLKEVMESLRWSERGHAYKALKVVLHAIRDRLPVALSAHFSAQLPILVRGIYFEGWRPEAEETPNRSRDAFLLPINQAFSRYPGIEAETVAAAVFDTIRQHISPGEIDNVVSALPKAVREILTAPFTQRAIPSL